MTKLCKCGHKKTDHHPRGLDLTMGRANLCDVTRCHAYDCDCLEFSGAW